MSRSTVHRWAVRLSLAIVISTLGLVTPPAGADDADGDGQPTGPVEIPAYTTETTQVFALPDGRYQLVSHQQPVRVQQDGDWVPINTTLVQAADGTWSPRATSVPLALSDGGSTTPLLTMGEPGGQVTMAWDGVLPEPTADGPSLTYADVRPGVDLVMTAQPRGYSQVLVVHDHAAASALAADPATLTVDGDGLSVTKSSDGAVSAANDEVTFSGAPPMQWDSSGLAGDEGTATDSGTAEIREVAATYHRIDDNTLGVTVAPPAATLADASTTYPIYVDPKMSEAGQPHTLTVHEGGWDYYDDTSEPLRVGYCGWSFCTSVQGNSRSYFSFDVSALTGTTADPHIDNAVVKAYQMWNASSSATAVNLTKSGAFSAGTNYPGPFSTTLQQVSSAAGAGGNNEGWITFQNANVDQYVADTVKNEGGSLRFSLSAPASNDKYLWKKFGNNSAYNPTIEITYAFAPTTPTGLTFEDAVDCNGETTRTTDKYLGLMARSTDQNPTPVNTQHHFEVWRDADGGGIDTDTDVRSRYNSSQSSETNVPSGAWAKFHSNWSNSANTNPLSDGVFYFRDRAHSEPTYGTPQYSGWSSWKVFALDTTPPSVPKVSSHDYPLDQWGASLASPGTFNIASNSDAVGFSYAFDNDSPPVITGCDYSSAIGSHGYVPATGGKGTITAHTTLAKGVRHTLTVRAFDKAHLMSGPSATYSFYVPLTVPGVDSSNATFNAFPKFRYEPELSAVANTVTEGADLLSTVSDATDSGGQEVVVTPSTTPNVPSPADPAVVTYNLPVPVAGYYAVGVDLNQRPDGGQLGFRVKDAPVTDAESGPITADTYAAARADRYVSLGGVSVAPVAPGVQPSIKLSVAVTGKNDLSTGYAVSIDKFHLVPLRAAAFSSLTAAFDNNGIGTDGTLAGRLTADQDRALSKASLTLAGLTPGTGNANGGTASVGGVSFTMPPTRSDSGGKVLDNVISAGQEISLPSGTTVPFHTDADGTDQPGHVNLLVASTCRTINPLPTDATHAISIKYGNPNVPANETDPSEAVLDDLLTKVPDWLAPRDSSVPGTTLDRYLQGTAAVTSTLPSLYVLRFPVHQNYLNNGYVIRSVTLPRVGTDLRNDCSTAALHVFAMTLTAD